MIHGIPPPAWLDQGAFPFQSRLFAHAHGRMHYVDEGTGPVILFVHGTPDWSFGFRHLIKAFRTSHRCVAIDHLGFGISEKPANADYTVKAHAQRLEEFIAYLGLKDLTLVVTDFGGGIGLQHAIEHPANVKGIVLYNTWMWDLMPDKRFSRPSALMNTWFGKLLYLRVGASVNLMMPSAYGVRSRLTPAAHAQYKNALPDRAARVATFACVQEIANAGPFWNAQWARVDRIREIPTLLGWGMKDRFFPPDLMVRWKQALPLASVHEFPGTGHFVHEEAPMELHAAMRTFLR